MVLAIATMSCMGPATTEGPASGDRPAPPANRLLVMAIKNEPRDLAIKTITAATTAQAKLPFNASLALIDGAEQARPYLAEALPTLNSSDWQVFTDGRMETTHRLRPGLTWHDGQPLTAEDFVFASQVYAAGGNQIFRPTPQSQIEEVAAPDPRTVVIRWRSSYPFADSLPGSEGGLDPLPRHILGDPFAAAGQDLTRFMGLPFWTSEYIGAGPFVLTHWELGSYLAGRAFDGHALGRPKVDRIELRFMGDENVVLAAALAGTVDVVPQHTLAFQNGVTLKQQWEASGRGQVQFITTGGIMAVFQMRSEFANPPELVDRRVRQALVFASDRQGLTQGVFDGLSPVLDTLMHPRDPLYPEVERAITKYAYDPRRAQELLTAAGLTRDRDGLFVSSNGSQFRVNLVLTEDPDLAPGGAIIVDGWRRAGIIGETATLPLAQARVAEARASFPALSSAGGAVGAMGRFISSEIGTATNGWVGQNRGGWSNSEYDRLWVSLKSTLAQAERARQAAQMAKILNDEVPVLPLYGQVQPLGNVNSVKGIRPGVNEYSWLWNLYEWEMA